MANDKGRIVEVEKGYPGKTTFQDGYKGPSSSQSQPPSGGSGVTTPANQGNSNSGSAKK